MFSVKQVGKTLVTRSAGTKIASDGLKGRVFECSLADLNQVRLLHTKICVGLSLS